jgi:hypothetical protein
MSRLAGESSKTVTRPVCVVILCSRASSACGSAGCVRGIDCAELNWTGLNATPIFFSHS